MLLTAVTCPPIFFFFNDTATTEIYTLSLHDALPIWEPRHRSRRSCSSTTATSRRSASCACWASAKAARCAVSPDRACRDRKSTRLNSSHLVISYAVFCLKKKKKISYRLLILDTPFLV